VNLRSPRLVKGLLLAAALVVAIVLANRDIPYLSPLLAAALVGGLALAVLWGAWRLLQAFLWKVGRRLAFSYFLIGVLPIPMALLALAMTSYLLAGFFLNHLYRDAARALQEEVAVRAEERVREVARTGRPAAAEGTGLVFATYREGRKVTGDERLPKAWPAWLSGGRFERTLRGAAGTPAERELLAPFVTADGGTPAVAAAATADGWGVVALSILPLEAELSARSDVWVEMARPGEAGSEPIRIDVFTRSLQLQVDRQRAAVEAEKFFRQRSQGERFWDSPFLWWGDTSGSMARLDGGATTALHVALHSTPRVLLDRVFSNSAEIDALAWGALLGLSFLLFDVYAAATVMSLFLIFGLSRAVNRLSKATTAVQSGDFAVRIPVRRRDQVGALQRSFNQMAANLETLVAAAAQKELLDKELALARDLQKSLLPANLPAHLPSGRVEIASLFEPSAALGGDYFDILRLDERRLAVFIADVSGHGLSSGLRMAMIKAALLVLVEEESQPEAILRRLDGVVRAQAVGREGREGRFFVTATLALLDLQTGTLDLTNAGHPPTYVLHNGVVEEILLPGSALGGLGKTYGRRTVTLAPGDVAVWLSDGLIEAPDPAGDPFGYEEVVAALAGPNRPAHSAAEVRDRLLQAVDRHAAGRTPEDDRTLVVLRWMGGPG
jgi:serine phosphatase RsbU (regulator of sigma subunit)